MALLAFAAAHMPKGDTDMLLSDFYPATVVEKDNRETAAAMTQFIDGELDNTLTDKQKDELEHVFYMVAQKYYSREWYIGQLKLALAEVYREREYPAVIKGTFPPTPKCMERFHKFNSEVARRLREVPPGYMAAWNEAANGYIEKNKSEIEYFKLLRTQDGQED